MMKIIENETIIVGRIIKIHRNRLSIGFDGKMATCHISEVSDYLVKDLRDLFTLYADYNFLIIKSLPYDEYEVSFKKIHPKFLKWHHEIIPTPSKDNNLRAITNDIISKMHS